MSVRNATYALMQQAANRGVVLSFEDANTLRRAQITLHRWAEAECGDSNTYGSWAIERDEQTGIPYLCRYPHAGTSSMTRIPDREAGALCRIRTICMRLAIYYYHQTDPRGCALYIAAEPIQDNDYTRGIAFCA